MPHLSLQTPADGSMVVSLNGTEIGAGTVTQLNPAAGIVSSQTYTISDKEVTIAIRVVNTSAVSSPVLAFGLPTFKFTGTFSPTSTLQSWHWTYLQANDCLWPSLHSPVGCPFVTDGKYCLSAYSPSEADINSRYLIQAAFTNGQLSNPLQLQLYTTQIVEPGASIDVTVVLRITPDASQESRLAGWDALLPTNQYDQSPIGPCIAANSVDQSWITTTNPGGYNGPERNIQIPATATSYAAAQAALLQKIQGTGIIFWAPGGAEPPANMYPTDYDINFAKIAATWPLITGVLSKQKFQAGICSRFDQADSVSRLAPVAAAGVTLWYMDSAGADVASIQRIIQARSQLGPKHRFFSEMTTDYTNRFADVYCEWTGTQTHWLSETLRADLKYLNRKATWLCVDRSNMLKMADYPKLGLVPLVSDACAWTGVPA